MNKKNKCENSQPKEDDENDLAQPGPSGVNAVGLEELRWNSSTQALYRENLKQSSSGGCSLQGRKDRPVSPNDSSTSDESCVYMYKGEDLPPPNRANLNNHSSSPEMDFLEVDFDSCQSNDQDSSAESFDGINEDFHEDESVVVPLESHNLNEEEISDLHTDRLHNDASVIKHDTDSRPPQEVPPEGEDGNQSFPLPQNEEASCEILDINDIPHTSFSPSSVTEDINSHPQEDVNVICREILRKHFERHDSLSFHPLGIQPCCSSQLVNILDSLIPENAPHNLRESAVNEIVEDTPLYDLLMTLSSSCHDIVQKTLEVIHRTTEGRVIARFFPSSSIVSSSPLSTTLEYWILKGATVLIVGGFDLESSDLVNVVNPTWHFETVLPAKDGRVQLSSDKNKLSDNILNKLLLENQPFIFVSSEYIFNHWHPFTDMKPFLFWNKSWAQFNVLGQVCNYIRNFTSTGSENRNQLEPSHIKLPSFQDLGILVLIRSDHENAELLINHKRQISDPTPLKFDN